MPRPYAGDIRGFPRRKAFCGRLILSGLVDKLGFLHLVLALIRHRWRPKFGLNRKENMNCCYNTALYMQSAVEGVQEGTDFAEGVMD